MKRIGSCLLVLLLAACGSNVTVNGTGQGALIGQGPGLGSPDGAPTTPAAPGDSPNGVGAGGTTRPSATDGSVDGAVQGGADPSMPSAGDGFSSDQSSSSALDGPGVTANSIKVGVAYDPNSEQGNASVGAAGTGQGDVRNFYNALFDEINKAGGIAGRKISASYFKADSTTSETTEQVEQAACAQWTQDTRVFAAFDINDDFLRQCLGSKGVLTLNSGASNSIASTFSRFPFYVEIGSIGLDRSLTATAEGLSRTDYYGKAPKIGIVAWDGQTYRTAVERNLIPALKALGHPPTDTVYIRTPLAVGDLGGSSADVSSAVLRFRRNGVTHVFIVDGPAGVFSGTGLTLLFIKSASSQKYYPRYGMNDSNSPQAAIDAGLWTASDVQGSRVVSSSNYLDASDVGITPNTARKECLALLARHGIREENVNQRGFMLRACEYVWFLRTVLGTQRLDHVDRAGFMTSVASLRDAFRAPTAYRTFFSQRQHDGAAGLRLEALSMDCKCYRYLGGVYAAPNR